MCLYVAVLFVSIVLTSIFGTLEFACSKTVPSTFVIYFLNAKSNSLVSGFLSIKTIGWVSSIVAFEYNVIFVIVFAVPFS